MDLYLFFYVFDAGFYHLYSADFSYVYRGEEMKISDLRTMRIVNMADGKILGKISDLVMDVNRGYVKAIIMPGDTKWPVFWSSERELEVPWENIKKIGQDIIIVDMPLAWAQKNQE